MKTWVVLVAIGTSLWGQQAGKVPSSSYAIGHQMGADLKKNGMSINLDEFILGWKDAQAGKSSFDEKALAEAMQRFQQEWQEKAMAKKQQEGDANLKAGMAFLASNKSKTGIQTTSSGLQYKILKEGKGAKPSANSKVKVHYTGKLLDGTVFDSSVQRGEPATFGVNQVIKGWTEALQLMPSGSKWELYIPAELGYGAQGAPGGKIGANSTLIFEVELLEIL